MNPLIKKQLENCRVAQFDPITDETTEVFIEKITDANNTSFQLHKCYLIEIADYIIHPSSEFTLADNWNKGKIPQDRFMKCEVSQIMGKMVRVSGTGYDPVSKIDGRFFNEYWLPIKGVKILKELK